MTPLLLALPWAGLLLFVLVAMRLPRELPAAATPDADRPSVSVVVPARNEALNIERCVGSLTGSSYPDFEIIVVDDRSDDQTAALAASMPRGNARRLRVVEGSPLPEGWMGKPWACHQGSLLAEGEILLFTDADTTHGPRLLERSVAGLQEEEADLLTLLGRQLMETFWERVVQPQIFLMMLFRFPDLERALRNDRWRDALANGQFLLFRRSAYESIGGHECVFDEVVEDLALAQHVKRAGLALRLRGAKDDLSTRMYRSLGDLVAGWSKNMFVGGIQSVAPALRPFIVPVAIVSGAVLWLLAPIALVSAALGLLGGAWLLWASTVYALSAAALAAFTRQMNAPAIYGLAYPLGAAVGMFILVRSWLRGRRVEWKGREYRVRSASARP